MAIQIQEKFRIEASIERAWQFLSDPQSVAACLPGVEITKQVDERTFQGDFKFKMGLLSLNFPGQVQIVERDEQAYRIGLVGEGRDQGAASASQFKITSQLYALSKQATESAVSAEYDLAGKSIPLGRGFIENVVKGMAKQFSQCVEEKVKT